MFILTSLASTIYIALGKHYTGPGSFFLYQLHAICEIFVNYAGRHLVPSCLWWRKFKTSVIKHKTKKQLLFRLLLKYENDFFCRDLEIRFAESDIRD